MPPSRSRRRPPLFRALPGFLPALACIAVASLVAHPLVLVPLLAANVLGMAAACHAIGFGPEPGLARTVLRRGVAFGVLFTLYTAVVLALVAWPLVALTRQPSLPAVLLLSVALAAALAVLWRAWPAFGLTLLWDEALPDSDRRSWIATAIARSIAFARHLTVEDRFFTHFLPAASALLVLAFGALALSGLYGVLPPPLRGVAVLLYGLLLMPAAHLLIANRTLRAMLSERQLPAGHRRDHTEATPVAAPAPPRLAPHETAPGARDGALLAAARSGDVERALALLDAGADPDTGAASGDRDQRPVLTLAALLADTRLLRALITRGADVNRRHAGLTPLLAATRDSYHGRAEAVMMLLANGADPRLADTEGHTALHGAALSAEPSVAAMLLDAEAPLDALNRNGVSPLAAACRAANWPLVRFLLERGADPAPAGGEPALVAAAGIADDDTEGVRLLLKRRAAVNAGNKIGRTALMAAALEGHAGIVAVLLKAGADPDRHDRNRTTALMEAARSGAEAVVRALAAAGADPARRDAFGRDALLLACQSPRAQAGTVRALLEHGADPRASADDGRSALDQAAAAGRWDLVALLDPDTPLPASIEACAEPDAGADSPADLADALRFGHWAVASTFVRRLQAWSEGERAGLLLALSGAEHSAARAWLLQHGLCAEARLDDGRSLFEATLETLPDGTAAALALLAAGASPAGAGRLARALRRLGDGGGDELLQDMLERGADPFGSDDGATPLHLAAAQGREALLRRLLAMGADPNVRDPAGGTPLHAALAAARPAPHAVRALIAAGADPEAAAANSETPLGQALTLGDPQLQRWLQWNGAWLLPGRPLRGADLPAAAAVGDTAAVRRLLELGFGADTRDDHGASALLHACGSGHRDTALALLEAGADIDLAASSGVTPLAAAVNARRTGLVTVLLEHGARLDRPLPGGSSVLMLAAALGYPDIVERLLDAGAALDARDDHGRSALHVAAQYCFGSRDSLRARRLLDVLIARGADVNAASADGQTPLLLLLGAHVGPGQHCDATHIGALVPVLLDAGARIDQADQRGVGPLHACAMHALLAPARVLVGRGADRAAVDRVQRTAAELARLLGFVDVAVELGDRGVPSVRQTLRQPAQPD